MQRGLGQDVTQTTQALGMRMALAPALDTASRRGP